jgi:chaperone required for assembly of F1-ATPase
LLRCTKPEGRSDMRELFEEAFGKSPLDPNESARGSSRPTLRKRFYKQAAIASAPGGHAVALDGRGVRTPAKRPLVAPQRAVAESIAAEWEAQIDAIDPAAMPLTRLANSIIDGVIDRSTEVADDIARYFSSDLLFYRAEHPEGLVAQQAQHWDPVLAWMGDAFGARFVLAAGVVHVAQPDTAITAARGALPKDPWSLGALHVATTLTGSALLALALAHGRLDVPQAWAAANVDEDWNLDLWGRDESVAARHAARLRDLEAAAKILDAARG